MSRKPIVKPSRLRIDRKKDETSQMGRLINYLNREEDKGAMIDEALKNFYLVEALKAEGVRSREDFRDIVYKCAEKLIAQARSILHIGGIDPQSLSLGGGIQLTSRNAHPSNQVGIAEEQSASLNSTPEEGKEESNVEVEDDDDESGITELKLKDEDEDEDDDDDDESSEGFKSFLEEF